MNDPAVLSIMSAVCFGCIIVLAILQNRSINIMMDNVDGVSKSLVYLEDSDYEDEPPLYSEKDLL